MRASRGGSASAGSRLPSSVIAPSPSSAPERGEQCARLGERGARRRIEERQRRRIADAPGREIERQAGEIGGEDLRLRERRERRPFAASSHRR